MSIIGSPPCTDWSTLMNLNLDRMDQDVVVERKRVEPKVEVRRSYKVSDYKHTQVEGQVVRREYVDVNGNVYKTES